MLKVPIRVLLQAYWNFYTGLLSNLPTVKAMTIFLPHKF